MVRATPKSAGGATPQVLPARFARGWHCLGLSHTFRTADSHSLKAFGGKLLAHTDSAGRIQASLAFADRQRELPALEQHGLLFVWHDPQGNPPPAHLGIPHITGEDRSHCGENMEWSGWAWKKTALTARTGRVMEHIVRLAESPQVATGDPLYLKNVFEGQQATQYFEGPLHASYQLQDAAPDGTEIVLADSVASYYGPAVMIAQLDYVFEEHNVDAVVLTAHYPVDEHHLVLMTGVMVRTGRPPALELKAVAAQHATQILRSITGAVHAQLENAADEAGPAERGASSPVTALRRWYAQFFVDTKDVTEKMTDRFEYELDTTMPMNVWTRSSARNLILRRVNGKQLV